MSNNLKLFKTAVGLSTKIGVAVIVSSVVEGLVPKTTTPQKVFVFAGTVGISGMVGDAAADHLNTKIDLLADWLKENRK